mmetsp:Transcript_13961/g.10065  ORF Transcript_13961/g.10065 Transcript_13961/m.10065 type:complete len:88 (+) Transcript_13961:1633-1896(+)
MALVMLNMLIAIMSDTYGRVMLEIIPSDYYELNNIILEQEELKFCSRTRNHLKYLHFAYYSELDDKAAEWEGAQAALKTNEKDDAKF